MGNQLEKPVTTKETRKGTAFDFAYCASGMQGYRANNEDTVMTKEKVRGPTKAAMFGVFDGHGGARMSNEALNGLENFVFSETEALNLENKEAVAKALSDGFLAFDGEISRSQLTTMGLDSSGTTAIVAVLNDQFVYFSNAGDSRGAYYRAGKCLFGTKDHKPSLPEEQDRITKAGGTVTWDRVCGDLAVSRGFGDFTYKKQEGDPREFMVTALPDVNFFQRNQDDDFIVLACDGLWDVLSNEEMGTGVRCLLFKHQGNHALVVEELVDECLKLGSSDNLSAAVIFFPASQKYHTTSTNETWPPERKPPPPSSSSASSSSSAPAEPSGPSSAEQNSAQANDDSPKLNPL